MWLRALAFVALSLCAAPSWGATTFDAASSAHCGGCTSLTFAHTVSGADRVLLVGPSAYDSIDSVVGVTYSAVSMTVIPSSSATNGSHTISQYGLIAPATGTNNVVVSGSGGALTDLGAGAVSVTGADQTTPFGTAATATGNGTTPSVNVSSAADELVVDTLNIIHGGTLTGGAGQTERWNAIAGSGFIKYAGSTEAGSGTTTMSWSNSSAQDFAIAAVPIKPAAAGGPTLRLRTMVGAGL